VFGWIRNSVLYNPQVKGIRLVSERGKLIRRKRKANFIWGSKNRPARTEDNRTGIIQGKIRGSSTERDWNETRQRRHAPCLTRDVHLDQFGEKRYVVLSESGGGEESGIAQETVE